MGRWPATTAAGSTRRLPPDGDRDGVPGAALHHRAGEPRSATGSTTSPSAVFGRGRGHARPRLLDLRLVLPGQDHPGQVLSLREKEFIEAALMTGASDWRIMRSHLLPHLVAPIIVYSTLIVAQFILAEAGLSFLGSASGADARAGGTCSPAGPTYYTTSRGCWSGRARDPDDARLQPARRRPAGRVRPARASATRSRRGSSPATNQTGRTRAVQ